MKTISVARGLCLFCGILAMACSTAKTSAYMPRLFTEGQSWEYKVKYNEDDDGTLTQRTWRYRCSVTETQRVASATASKVVCSTKPKNVIRQHWSFDGVFVGTKAGVWLLGEHAIGKPRTPREKAAESTWPPPKALVQYLVQETPPFYAARPTYGAVNPSGTEKPSPTVANSPHAPGHWCTRQYTGRWQADCSHTVEGIGMSSWEGAFDPQIGFYSKFKWNTDEGFTTYSWTAERIR